MKQNTQYTIKSFKTGIHDSSEIAKLHLAIRRWQEKIGQITFSNILESQIDLNKLEEYYIAPGGNFFVAENIDGAIIGFVALHNDGNGKGTIKRLAVLPDYHRRGIARALVSETVNWAKQNGFLKISLHTNIGEKARPIYEQFGFKVVGFVDEHEDWTMEANLR